jgi:hypothetical protein
LRSFGQPAVNKELIDPFLFHVLSVIAGIILEKCWFIHGCGSTSTKLNS